MTLAAEVRALIAEARARVADMAATMRNATTMHPIPAPMPGDNGD